MVISWVKSMDMDKYIEDLHKDFKKNIVLWRVKHKFLTKKQWIKIYDLIMQKAGKRRWNTKLRTNEEYIVKLLRKYSKKDNKILDAGCGTGKLMYHLYNHGYTNLSGADFTRICIDYCNRRNKKYKTNINFFEFNIESELDNSFMYEKFDTIISCEVLEHTRRPDSIIDNIYEMLKDNGIAIFCFPNKDKRSSWTHINLFFDNNSDFDKIIREKPLFNYYNIHNLFDRTLFDEHRFIIKKNFIFVIGRK
jgi:2-polyprenyl-3-methyl-5-hydroxy-6-metoxy-1,4-benzoquinol methylase